jgi:hypothetical protein
MSPGPTGSELFREKAVSAIDSVERFDEAIAIVSARAQIAMAAIAALMILAVAWAVWGRVPVGLQGRGVIVTGSGTAPVIARLDGTLISEPGQVGDIVPRGAAVARVRTTAGTIVALRAPANGRLAARSAPLGSFVQPGDIVAEIEPTGAVPSAVLFVPVETDRRVAVGMQVRLSPADAPAYVFGFLRGYVTYVAPLPATTDRIKASLENGAVAAGFSQDVAVREVHVALDVDAQGNVVWSGIQKGSVDLSPGTPCYGTVVVEDRAPISFVLPQTR